MQKSTASKLKSLSEWLDIRIAESDPGDHLPTVREMMRRFSTAQRTVERALQPYLEKGCIRARPGAGIIV